MARSTPLKVSSRILKSTHSRSQALNEKLSGMAIRTTEMYELTSELKCKLSLCDGTSLSSSISDMGCKIKEIRDMLSSLEEMIPATEALEQKLNGVMSKIDAMSDLMRSPGGNVAVDANLVRACTTTSLLINVLPTTFNAATIVPFCKKCVVLTANLSHRIWSQSSESVRENS